MKLLCKRESLLSVCQTAFRVASTKNIKPILACVKLSSKDGVCTLSATDLELWLRVKATVESCEDGEAMLPGKIVNILRESDSEEIAMDLSDDRCIVKLRNGKFDMATLHASEFPDFETSEFDRAIELSAEMFNSMVNKTMFAAGGSGDTSLQGVTNGVNIELNNGKLTFTGANSKSLATICYDAPYSETASKVAPKKFLELATASADDSVLLNLFIDNLIAVKTGNVEIRSKLIDGRFPKTENLIPKESTFTAILNVGTLLTAVKQAAIMTDDMANRITFAFTSGKLALSANESVHGKSSIDMDVECSGSLTIVFNPIIWIAMLGKLDPTSSLKFAASSDRRPAVLSQDNYRFLAVPMYAE